MLNFKPLNGNFQRKVLKSLELDLAFEVLEKVLRMVIFRERS